MTTTFSKAAALAACALLMVPMVAGSITGCGGEIEPEPDSAPRVHPADPDVLPTGSYAIDVSAASCNVNDMFLRRDRAFLIRKDTGVNVPLPFRMGAPGRVSGTPRQDRDLRQASSEWVAKNEATCPGGTILVTMTMTELTSSRVAFAYREEPRGCAAEACTVDFAFELAERACPPATDPGCAPERKRVPIGPGAAQDVTCECAAR